MAQQLVVAITGSGQGIGRALARRFARDGARVVVSDVDTAACQGAADELATLGVPADITRADDCAALVAKTVAEFGRLDVMICNAGIMQLKPLLELDAADWNRMLGVNVTGSFLTLQAAARRMLAQEPLAEGRPRGKIIMMASIAGRPRRRPDRSGHRALPRQQGRADQPDAIGRDRVRAADHRQRDLPRPGGDRHVAAHGPRLVSAAGAAAGPGLAAAHRERADGPGRSRPTMWPGSPVFWPRRNPTT